MFPVVTCAAAGKSPARHATIAMTRIRTFLNCMLPPPVPCTTDDDCYEPTRRGMPLPVAGIENRAGARHRMPMGGAGHRHSRVVASQRGDGSRGPIQAEKRAGSAGML